MPSDESNSFLQFFDILSDQITIQITCDQTNDFVD